MVTEFAPTSSGIGAVQLVVPLAVPDCPVLVAQVTAVTPRLSLAVPAKLIEDAVVETEVDAGDVMVSEGGVLFAGVLPVGAFPVVAAGWRVTVMTWDT